MKVTQSTANLLQLTRFGLVNCYLVREEDGFTLVMLVCRAVRTTSWPPRRRLAHRFGGSC